jgi:hypothetical protein
MRLRATDQFNAAPRCGARTRSGEPCQGPAVRGRMRCRMHGGAAGSGAPLLHDGKPPKPGSTW